MLVGAFAALAFDTIGSLASRAFDFKYESLFIGSWLLYIGVGFFAARGSSFLFGVLAGGFVALVEATLGWYISWVIGPGRPKVEVTWSAICWAVLSVTLSGISLGFVGEFVGQRF